MGNAELCVAGTGAARILGSFSEVARNPAVEKRYQCPQDGAAQDTSDEEPCHVVRTSAGDGMADGGYKGEYQNHDPCPV